ncbi:Uncharacterised protein [Segatella copri]|nr:Uncharacterised protein [Segatella copri]
MVSVNFGVDGLAIDAAPSCILLFINTLFIILSPIINNLPANIREISELFQNERRGRNLKLMLCQAPILR